MLPFIKADYQNDVVDSQNSRDAVRQNYAAQASIPGLSYYTIGLFILCSTWSLPTIPDKIVDTSPLPPIQCWSTLSHGQNSLVGLLIAEPTLNRGEGVRKKIILGSSGGNTMCMTDDISKKGQN